MDPTLAAPAVRPPAPWLDRTEYPFAAHYLTVEDAQLHYVDEGEGPPLLFVHGTPTWSFLFRHQIKALAAHYRCLAPDHIGFGLSDKPAAYPYTVQQHAQNLVALVDALQLHYITLVVHDFGGPIGLYLATQRPAAIARLVICNTWAWSSADDPAFIKFSKVLRSPLLPLLYKGLNFSPRVLIPRAFADRRKLTKAIHRHYYKPYRRPRERGGSLGFARSLLEAQEWFQQLWEARDAFCHRPTLLLWGMEDRFLSPRYLERFLAHFPQAKALRLEGTGHFVPEEAASEVTHAIKAFLAEPLP
ncbi:haloalkane dehalogenase [Catalinimonas alkaloidigena]|uniref:Haloalkane dehalogenase n=1 Tax=Catalinimonas alkaloidigena TaxID=1075417 RepID=A0A1G9BTT3_9BACT|nr:alpha/beta fold hydrolase [Catalinimonas alkaloidigena]SDK42872.1 haloalkane dehalogenase [Catalinimonas alkaloidigena]